MSNQFTNELLKEFRDDFTEAVKGLEKKYGVEISLGSIRYQSTSFEAKLSVLKGVGDKSPGQVQFEKNAFMYGLKNDDFGKVFTVKGAQYQIVSIDTKKRKYPLVVKDVNTQKEYGMTVDTVKRALEQ